MFEDDVTVPAGWYPDPMGLPQLRWWNNHAWTELTTEARPPLVMQVPTRLAYADEELPTRRQQREQREREEHGADLATDEGELRDGAAAAVPLTVTLREIDAPVPAAEAAVPELAPESDAVPIVETVTVAATTTRVEVDPDDEAIDPSDRAPAATEALAAEALAAEALASEPVGSQDYVPRTAFVNPAGSVLGSPVTAGPVAAGATAAGVRSDRTSVDDLPFTPRLRSQTRMPIYTASVWIIALVPLLLLVVSLLLLLGFGSSLNMWVTPAIWALSWIVVVILAITDRAALGRAGYEHRASWAWALLTAPIYLIARSMSLAKVGPLGFAPVLVWAALGILQIGSVLVVPGLIISALPHVFATQAEQSIASDASIIGADITVDCAKNLPVIVGQSFTCVATGANKDPFTVTASLQRSNGWINWHVEDWGVYTLSR
ncbi:DUF2510 domain-containing protein [Lacisediminihabitans sp. FW035]